MSEEKKADEQRAWRLLDSLHRYQAQQRDEQASDATLLAAEFQAIRDERDAEWSEAMDSSCLTEFTPGIAQMFVKELGDALARERATASAARQVCEFYLKHGLGPHPIDEGFMLKLRVLCCAVLAATPELWAQLEETWYCARCGGLLPGKHRRVNDCAPECHCPPMETKVCPGVSGERVV